MGPTLRKLLPDGLLIAGASSLSYGAWLAWEPAGYVVGGALALIAGLKLAAAQ